MDGFFELIKKRESCRNYSEKKVEREKLKKCIEAAGLAPSACNSQPWSFTVVDNPEIAPQVAKHLQGMGMNKFTDKCPAFVIVTEEKATLTARIGGKIKSQKYAPIDIGLATAQLCLAATQQELSTCIMGWFDEAKLKQLLDIAEEKRIRLVIAVGYAVDEEGRPKNRKSLEDIARFI